MAQLRQLSIKVTDTKYKQIEAKTEEMGYTSIANFCRAAIDFYMEQGKITAPTDPKDLYREFLSSEEGAMWFATLLDKELIRRAEKQFGDFMAPSDK